MSVSNTNDLKDFCHHELTDIREITFDEKSLECELLKIEIQSYKRQIQHWQDLYDSAIKSILDFCGR